MAKNDEDIYGQYGRIYVRTVPYTGPDGNGRGKRKGTERGYPVRLTPTLRTVPGG